MAEWINSDPITDPETGEEVSYNALKLISADGQHMWKPWANWIDYGTGYGVPIVVHWGTTAGWVWVADQSWPDGCAGFGSASRLRRINLETGQIEEMDRALNGVVSVAPSEKVVAAISAGRAVWLNVATGVFAVGEYQSADTYTLNGNIIWSPDENAFAFLTDRGLCGDPPSITIRRALLSRSKLVVDVLLAMHEGSYRMTEWSSEGIVLTSHTSTSLLLEVDSGVLGPFDIRP